MIKSLLLITVSCLFFLGCNENKSVHNSNFKIVETADEDIEPLQIDYLRCAILLDPSDSELEEISNKDLWPDWKTFEDQIYNRYKGKLFLESKGIEVIRTTSKILKFKKINGDIIILDRKKENIEFGDIIFFDDEKEPVMISPYLIKEEYKRYFIN